MNIQFMKLMASLDVESLFTNIPLEEGIENRMIYFWKLTKFIILKRKNLKNFLLLQHMNLFHFFMENITLKFDPRLPNAFLCYYLENLAFRMSCRFLPNIYKRYVDDILVTFDSYPLLLRFVDYMNHQHLNIKFTFKVEQLLIFRC